MSGSVELAPAADAAALFEQGLRLQQEGRTEAALSVYRRVVALLPMHVMAWLQLGMLLLREGDAAGALACFREAVARNPYFAEAYFGLGVALHRLGETVPAIAALQRAVALSPGHAQAHAVLGVASWDQGEREAGIAAYRTALRLDPDDAMTHFNLGVALQATRDVEGAVVAYRAALALRPAWMTRIRNNLGTALADLDRYAEAEEQFLALLAEEPDSVDATMNYGLVLHMQNRPDRARALLERAIAKNAGHALLRYNMSHVALLAGDFAVGWQHYEARWETGRWPRSPHSEAAPLWDGRPLADHETLLVHSEQGFGDTLQFIRYIDLLAARGLRLAVEVQPFLATFIRGQFVSPVHGAVPVVGEHEAAPHYDWQVPLLSLPRVLGTVLETIPARVPYLRAEPRLVAAWRRRMKGLAGLKVGLVWSGEPRPEHTEANRMDRRRSVLLVQLAPLAEVAGVQFVSVQLGAAAAQAKAPPPGMALHDWTADIHDFRDTAALVTALDLMICVDTSVLHLAGALGKPVWLLNRFDTCWRWLLGRDDSPWYPTLRQFRQGVQGEWDGVILAMRDALAELVRARDG